ncbi:MAG: lytic murein transglycosylase [Acetobacteraceae bacterium]|nr:lytic murein transglycosylase [Acetobacteraceae bacterium]
MLKRRAAIATGLTAVLAPPVRAAGSFQNFVNGVYAEAGGAGIRRDVLDAAFAGVSPNQSVIDKDRRQAEFSMTWTRYRGLVISDKRITNGRVAVAQNRALFSQVESRFGVSASVIAGIWGLESSFGTTTGDYKVIESIATLAWEGRRAAFFRAELMAALKILNNGDIAPARMLGSYAGAMGQPQFMPTSFLRLAVDFDGDGRRDIWNSKADVLGSIANYLARSGWRAGETWGQPVRIPAGVPAAGRETRRSLSEWARLGVTPTAGKWAASGEAPSALLAPDGAGGETFMVFNNFTAIRRYNPSDFYAIAVGLIGDWVMS